MTAPWRAELRRSVKRADLARYAGVSSAVVSYVVNNGPKPVAAATASRMRKAIDVLGYRPNLSARALRRGTTQMLGLVVHNSSNPFLASFALEITDEAARRGYVVLMINSRSDVEHLITVHGHTSVGIVIGSDGSDLDRREEGWQDAVRAAGLADGPIARVPFGREGSYLGGQRLLANDVRLGGHEKFDMELVVRESCGCPRVKEVV